MIKKKFFSGKKSVLVAGLALLLGSCYQQRRMVNGMNNLAPTDWAGIYEGKLPCADCPGIDTRIVFNNDGTFIRTSQKPGDSIKPYRTIGQSSWDQEKGLIILQDSGSSLTVPYRMNKKGLIMMHLGTGARPRPERSEYTLMKTNSGNPTEHYWSLVELNGKPVSGNMPDGKPHILFHGSTGKADGSGGCNRFSGNFELRSGNKIQISPLAATRMACPGNTEAAFFKTMEGTSFYNVKNDKMTLSRDGKVIARFEAVWMQ